MLAPVEASILGSHRRRQAPYEDLAMTIEILHFAAQLQNWINRRVARHIAEQAEKLTR